MIGFLIAIFFGIIFAIALPAIFAGSTTGVGAMLAGHRLHIPYTDTTVIWSWFAFGVVSVLIYGLIKIAGK